MTRTLTCLVCFMIIGKGGLSQNEAVEDPYPRLTKIPIFSIEYTPYSRADYDHNNATGESSLYEFRGFLQAAFPIQKKKTYLLHRFDFTSFRSISENSGSTGELDYRFHSFSIGIGLIKVLENRRTLVGMVTSSVASDFKDPLSTKDIITQATLIGNKRINRRLEMGVGVAYSTQFGRHLVIPLISTLYKNEKWQYAALLPVSLLALRNLGTNHQVGVRASVFGNVYNANTQVTSNFELDKLGYTRINIGPIYQMNFYKDLHIFASTGITVRNQFESIDSSGDREFNLSVSDRYYFNVGLQILK